MWERTTYVTARRAAQHTQAAEEWEEATGWDEDAEIGMEQEITAEMERMAAADAEQEPPEEDEVEQGEEREAMEPEWGPPTATSSPGASVPSSAASTAASTPVPTRPPSPATERRRRVFAEDDAGSDDEQETVGDMMSRILQRQEEAECAYERRRSLTVRGAMNARTGLTYMMRVGEVEPAEHGRGHERRRAAEGGRVGRATAKGAEGCLSKVSKGCRKVCYFYYSYLIIILNH